MWRWILAVGLVAAGGALAADDCPDMCRCYWDHDSYRSAQCNTAATNPHHTDVFPSIQVLNIKPIHKSLNLKLAPKMFQRFRNIKILNLSNSSISQIPYDVFFGLRYVSDIDLSYNRIRYLKGIVFKNLPALQTLLLRGNPLTLTPFESIISDTLKELDMGECGLKTVPRDTFANVQRLTHLSLDGNQLQTVTYQSIPNNLRYLNLASNKIANVPTKVLLSLSFLRRIDLSDNPVNCTCALMLMQDWFSGRGVALENDLICDAPDVYRGKSLNKIDENELCKYELHKERQMNKLRYSYKPRDTYHIGSEFNTLPTHDVLMADEPKPGETEVLFSNEETRSYGSHMENNGGHSGSSTKESIEEVEGSGSDADITIDSQEHRHTTFLDSDTSIEVVGRNLDHPSSEAPWSASSDLDNTIKTTGEDISSQNVSSVEDENSSKNQSFEIDSPPETDKEAPTTEHALHETSEEGSAVSPTTEESEGSGDGPPILPEFDNATTKVELIDDNISPSTPDSVTEEITPETTEDNLETTSEAGVELEVSSPHQVPESEHTTSHQPETTTEIHDIHTVPISVSMDSESDKTTSGVESTSREEVTEPVIVRKIVVTDELERYADISTEASISNGTDDVSARADTAGVTQSVTTYIIIAVIALPVVFLILMAACRKKSPRKVRLPQDAESNLGTELQDMDTLLPKNGAEKNGVKVVPKANGAANPADSKTPEEVAPVLQAEPEPEPPAEPLEPPPPSRQNGGAATSPIQKTKAKLTVLADSIPKTPLFIHKAYPE